MSCTTGGVGECSVKQLLLLRTSVHVGTSALLALVLLVMILIKVLINIMTVNSYNVLPESFAHGPCAGSMPQQAAVL